MTDNSPSNDKKKRPSFTTWIVIGLVAGVAWGLFFGDTTNWTKWIGDVYVGLLQMAVLPYIALSLMSNIGRLTIESGKQLLRTGLVVLLGLWAIGLVCLFIMAQAFPAWEAGSFFSSRFVEEPEVINWLNLFVPSNPFRSLVENSIPAVVVFSIGLGIALIGMPDKAGLLDPLDVIVEALGRLNKLVVKLTPLGMFGIVAHTAGTIEMEQFRLIQGYLLTYGAAAILLSFVILPAFVAAVTPFTFMQVTRAARNPLITAFVIGNTFVVLPMMIEAIREMRVQLTDAAGDDDVADPEYLVPLAYPFPDIGRIVGLIFIPFAAWFYGASIDADQMPALMGTGLIGAFAKPVITIPLLLELAELPADIFNLFLASGVVAARFGDLMKTMHLMAFTIVVGCMLAGVAKFHWTRLLVTSIVSVALIGLAALGIRIYLQTSFQDTYSRENLITARQPLFPDLRPNSKVQLVEDSQAESATSGQSRIEQIRNRGVLRVGYDPSKMPFCYFRAVEKPNEPKKLIGFDVEMAWLLADDLGVDITFVPIQWGLIQEHLRDSRFDVLMSAFEGTVKQAELLASADPYMELTLALVVPDFRKGEFQSREQIRKLPEVTFGVLKGSFFAENAPKTLPEHISLVELESPDKFFQGELEGVDGLVISAEKGYAWTLRYPRFTVTNPLQGKTRVPLYYLSGDSEFDQFLEDWMVLKKADGTWQDLYDYWILGIEQRTKKPRWCIIRDVLGWVE